MLFAFETAFGGFLIPLTALDATALRRGVATWEKNPGAGAAGAAGAAFLGVEEVGLDVILVRVFGGVCFGLLGF